MLFAFALIGCGETPEKIDPAQNDYDMDYKSDYKGGVDAGVVIDGVLDDGIWENKNWFTNAFASDTTGTTGPRIYVTSYLSEKGVYVGIKADDNNIVYTGDMAPNWNTGVRLYVAALNVGEDYPTVYPGSQSGTYKHRFMVFDVGSNCYTRDLPVMARATYEGNKAEFEVFYPWTTLGVDTSLGVPDTVYLMPCYNAILPGKQTYTLLEPDPCPIYRLETLYRFNANGYKNVDAEGAKVGDAINGLAKNGDWDVSRESEGVVVSQVPEYQTIWFKKDYANNFKLETMLKPQNAGYLAGFNIMTTGGITYRVAMEAHTIYNGAGALAICSVDDDRAYNGGKYWYVSTRWRDSVGSTIPAEGLKFTVIKKGDTIYCIVDGQYKTKITSPSLNQIAIAGLWATDCVCEFNSYSHTALTDAEADTALAGYGYTA